ncbi:MAG: T9SS type A sorting domain-containing protein [Bacteroidia bacterium]
MKVNYIVVLILLSFFNTKAQYVLTSSHNLKEGDKVDALTAKDTTAQQGHTGSSMTWDFSNVVFNTEATPINYVKPNNTPYSYLCPDATVSYLLDNTWQYSKYSDSSYSDEGNGNENIEEYYFNDKRYYYYPFAYKNIAIDTFAGERNGTTQGNVNGTIVTKADGYGTIILPNLRSGIKDVLRIKIIEKKTVNIRGQTMRYIIETYQWFAKTQKSPLFSISRTTTVIENKTTGEIYTTKSKVVMMNVMSTVTEVNKPVEQLAKLTLFPNPAVNEVSVKFNYLPTTTATIDLVDISGKMIESFKTGDLSSSNDIYKLDITNYPKGTYFVRVVADKGMDVQKLIIQ